MKNPVLCQERKVTTVPGGVRFISEDLVKEQFNHFFPKKFEVKTFSSIEKV